MGDGPDYTGKFKVEYAKSGKSKCTTCQQLIDKDDLRIGAMVNSTKFDGQYPMWSHATCFEDRWMLKNPDLFTSADNVSGIENLKPKDMKLIKGLLSEGDTETAVKMTAEEKALAVESKKLWKIKQKLEGLTHKEMKEMLEYNDQPFSGKIFGGEQQCLSRIADGMMFGALPKCEECDDGDLRFVKGKYVCTGAIDAFTKCSFSSTDIEREGWDVPESLRDTNDFLSTFKFKASKEKIVGTRISAELKDEKRKAKREVSDSEDETEDDQPTKRKKGKKVLSNMKISFCGKIKWSVTKLRKIIEDLGGKYVTDATDINYLISNKRHSKTKKYKEAEEDGVAIVTEDWLEQIIETEELPSKEHLEDMCLANLPEETEREKRIRLADEAAIEYERKRAEAETTEEYTEKLRTVAPRQKIKVKGAAAVEPGSGMVDCGTIFTEKKAIYSVTMNHVDLVGGKNSYYILQLIAHDKKKQWSVYRKWGKTASNIGDDKLEHFPVLSAAKRDFAKIFEDKTGNTWEEYIAGDFTKQPQKMEVLEMDFGTNNNDEALAKTKSASERTYDGELDKQTQELIKLIFDISAMEDCLLEMEINTSEMPLGKLSKSTLKKGLEALRDLQDFIEENKDNDFSDDDDSKEKRLYLTNLTGHTNRFYTYIPHCTPEGCAAPDLIDTIEKLKAKNELVQSLMNMEIATTLMATDGDDHPIDSHYKKLKCEFTTIKKKDDTWKMVNKYLQNTHAPSHTDYKLELTSLWEINREGEEEKFEDHEDDPNRMLLWHGSRITNWGGIISQGLRIAPPEAPTTGYMFGKGVYFADMSSKSANYCFTSSDKTTGVMVLCEVALGKKPLKCHKAKYVEKLPKGSISCFGEGTTAPNPKQSVELDNGCVVPCGKPVDVKVSSSLRYNEFIVYDVSQIRMKYLLQLKFKYNKKCGTFF
eukprot:TRINITY_DN2692_c0_g1_i1.p1 TRINITY_DN2692_c0_g1~~TRINITY_DN2692_c0_g1_i1.p1  ORF type:complete len:930 (+),score=235.99 TRINITY_DN2692_c0_g1_i1:54-2843(+)